jgi:hypothetical protein
LVMYCIPSGVCQPNVLHATVWSKSQRRDGTRQPDAKQVRLRARTQAATAAEGLRLVRRSARVTALSSMSRPLKERGDQRATPTKASIVAADLHYRLPT